MKVRELIEMLKTLNQDMEIYAAIGAEDGAVRIEPVTQSCDDDTVIGYMITDDRTETVN